jgi:hypothetical protein
MPTLPSGSAPATTLLCPYAPWAAWASHRARLEAHRALDTPGTPWAAPTDLRTNLPEGTQGEGCEPPWSTTHRAWGSRHTLAES